MTPIVDFHTHRLAANAIVARRPDFTPQSGYSYAVGLHPWHLTEPVSTARVASVLSQLIAHSLENGYAIVSIGECGLDTRRSPLSLSQQIDTLTAHIHTSELLSLPLTLHCVGAFNHIVQLHRDMKPSRRWAIHGFRGKPQLADMLLRHDIMLSFGPLFNKETLCMVPDDMFMIETDDSQTDIMQVAALAAECRKCSPADIITLSANNILRFIHNSF